MDCFVNAKANSFENLLDPLIKIFRMSSLIITAVSASPKFLKKLVERLNHNKAVVRLNLLRILRAICDSSQDRQALVQRYGMFSVVQMLSRNDGAVLVRELAREIIPGLLPTHNLIPASPAEESRSGTQEDRRRTPIRRAASESKVETPLLPKPGRGRLKPVSRIKLNDMWKFSEDKR